METTQDKMTKKPTDKMAENDERKPSKIYAIKSFKANVTKLLQTGLITTQEHDELIKLVRKTTEKYMNEN